MKFPIRSSLMAVLVSWSLTPSASSASQPYWARFLDQATFGPTPTLLDAWSTSDPEAWINDQRSVAASRYPSLPAFPSSSTQGCPDAATAATCKRDNYSMYPLEVQFFQNALFAPDQLRQRVAFALSQIFVVSGVKISQPSSLSPFLNLLVDGAFGNYRDLLKQVTLNPAMGYYLDMVNNDKGTTDGKIRPNENYAREVLQLFSIGLYQLNKDGTQKLGSDGQPIATYDQDTVEGFAHVFTGFTFGTLTGATPKKHNPSNYLVPMEIYRVNGQDTNHDKGPKQLLVYPGTTGQVVAGQDAAVDLEAAIDNIFNHPNVGPFIGRRLIQALVTSNPSTDYVARVAQAFNNNGSGIRGDLFATVKAVLLDPEARSDKTVQVSYGKLREPVLMVTAFLRGMEATSDGILASQTKGMAEDVFYSPTFFNYFTNPYVVPGTNLDGPEFGVESSAVAIARDNFIKTLVYSRISSPATTPPQAVSGTDLNFTRLDALAADSNPDGLLDYLSAHFLQGGMTTSMKSIITSALSCTQTGGKGPCTNARDRSRTALYLVTTSAFYQVQR